MRVGALAAVAAITVASLSACAETTAVPEGMAVPSHPASPPVESVGEQTGASETPRFRESSEPVTCEGEGKAAVSFSTVDAALGHRYLFLTVRNCSPEQISLPAEPVFEGVEEDGTAHPDLWEWREQQGSLTLAPKEDKILVAHWLSNGRCERGVNEMRLHLFGETFSERDCYQFGGDMAPDRDGAAGDLYWADDPSHGPGWQPEE